MNEEKPTAVTLPDVARSILKSTVLMLMDAGLIAPADATRLIALLGLRDA